MSKKLRMTLRDLLLSSKDYTDYSKEELLMQYDIIINQYEKFKNSINNSIQYDDIKLELIKSNEIKKQYLFNKKILTEIEEHINNMETIINSY